MFLKIKRVPKLNWSSEKPYNFKPKFSTLFFCCFGLMLFGLGEGLLIVSFTLPNLTPNCSYLLISVFTLFRISTSNFKF